MSKSDLLAARLIDQASAAAHAGLMEWIPSDAMQAATLIDAACAARDLDDDDPRIVQMELAGYFRRGQCRLGKHGDDFMYDPVDDVDGEAFLDGLAEAARLDGMEQTPDPTRADPPNFVHAPPLSNAQWLAARLRHCEARDLCEDAVEQESGATARNAALIFDVADYVDTLEDDDPRVDQIDRAGFLRAGKDFQFPIGKAVASVLRTLLRDGDAGDPSAFLDALAAAAEKDLQQMKKSGHRGKTRRRKSME